jgi:hypothetical protein
MRLIMLLLLCALVAGATDASVGAGGRTRQRDPKAIEVVRLAAGSLVARAQPMPGGGRAWRSVIQAPHYQTDRDVGAASIGSGLLAAYGVTGSTAYLRAAEAAGDFLLGVAEPDRGGLRWPDWADPDGQRSTTHFTSFDDGAAGISDFLWSLFKASNKPRFRTAALGGMRWVVAQARGSTCPRTACSWRWTDDPDWRVAHNGVGMGTAGIVLALDAFADRTGDGTFRNYARAGAAYLRDVTAEGTRPLPKSTDDPEVFETGFLSGSAGAAFTLLERYSRDHDRADLAAANRLLRWVNDRALPDGRGGLSWPSSNQDDSAPSGFQLGAAGIAWVNLQAARITGDATYREVARRAAAWLRHVARDGGAWNEVPGDAATPVHVGLDSGAAGIGWVLEDIARAGLDAEANRAAARAALAGLRSVVAHDRLGPLWHENRTGARELLPAEPSWHWGAAGIAAFGARLAGWSGQGPDGQISP